MWPPWPCSRGVLVVASDSHRTSPAQHGGQPGPTSPASQRSTSPSRIRSSASSGCECLSVNASSFLHDHRTSSSSLRGPSDLQAGCVIRRGNWSAVAEGRRRDRRARLRQCKAAHEHLCLTFALDPGQPSGSAASTRTDISGNNSRPRIAGSRQMTPRDSRPEGESVLSRCALGRRCRRTSGWLQALAAGVAGLSGLANSGSTFAAESFRALAAIAGWWVNSTSADAAQQVGHGEAVAGCRSPAPARSRPPAQEGRSQDQSGQHF